MKGILLGYDHNEGYRILSEENKLIRSQDVIFKEKTLIQRKGINDPAIIDLPYQDQYPKPQDSELQTEEQSEVDTQHTEENDSEEEETQENTELVEEPEKNQLEDSETTARQLRDRSTIKRPDKYKDYVAYVSTDFKEPETYIEAIFRKIITMGNPAVKKRKGIMPFG